MTGPAGAASASGNDAALSLHTVGCPAGTSTLRVGLGARYPQDRQSGVGCATPGRLPAANRRPAGRLPRTLRAPISWSRRTRGATTANGGFGEYSTQITVPTTSVGTGSNLSYETYLVVGNRQRVADTSKLLHQQVG
jgi:hypothetical protein